MSVKRAVQSNMITKINGKSKRWSLLMAGLFTQVEIHQKPMNPAHKAQWPFVSGGLEQPTYMYKYL